MSKFNRRSFLKGSTLAVAGTVFGASYVGKALAAEHVLKYSNNLPTSHPMNIQVDAAVKRIQEQTDGAVKIQVYPNSALGGDTQVLGQLRAGGVQLQNISGLILSTLVPEAGINGIGFAFPDYDVVWKAMDGDLGKYIRDAIATRGLYAMPKIWDNGYREITTSTHPIKKPGDLKGVKMRVPISPLWTSLFKDLHASPTGINFSEVYTALQTGVVDGQENPLAIIETAKLYEVQKYCSMTNHMWDGFWVLANQAAWQALPEKYQEIIQKNLDQAGMEERAAVLKLNNSLEDKLESEGLKFNSTNPDEFRNALREAGFYSYWKKKFGDDAWQLLEKYAGNLS